MGRAIDGPSWPRTVPVRPLSGLRLQVKVRCGPVAVVEGDDTLMTTV